MGCTRNRSKIWDNSLFFFALLLTLSFPSSSVWAAFATQFSFLTGEEYSDNIFFSKNKDHDFVTLFIPRLSFFYAPEGQVAPTGILEISPRGEVYGRHSNLNNFADNIAVNGAYTYDYSPRLSFDLLDSFRRRGPALLGDLNEVEQLQEAQTSPPQVSGFVPTRFSQRLTDFVASGDVLTNFVSLRGSYLYRPDIRLMVRYENEFDKFITAGGTDVFHTLEARGVYNWRRDHNLHAGYTVSIANARNGDNAVIHNFDFGDDYFSNYNLQLTPTLSLAASTGISLNTSNDGPRVANNTNITITKLWETAELNAGLRKGLTSSFGVSGISNTTALFSVFNWRITEKLSTNAGAVFSFFDTDDVNFNTFQAGFGFQYLITSWLSSGLNYRFNWIDSGSGANQTDLLQKGTVKSNIVFLSVTARFDVWPNIGLARRMTPAVQPALTTPFPVRPPQSAP